ncbi:MAG: hypothetical protein KGS72_24780 [Cyanobacteria bacterium REEB67]|nr:hypothetical protein [Cyanobacteria bacterium REEB67]
MSSRKISLVILAALSLPMMTWTSSGAYTALHPSSRPISEDPIHARPRRGALSPAAAPKAPPAPVISAPPLIQPGNSGPSINIAPANNTNQNNDSPFVTPSLTVPDGGTSVINPASLGTGALQAPAKPDVDKVTGGSVTNDVLNDTITRDAITRSKVREELIMPKEEIIFLTKFGQVIVQPGALVLLIDDERSASIYDLHDGKGKTVSVDVDGHLIHLSPGKTVTLCSPSIQQFPQVNRLPYVGYARIEKEDITPQVRAFQGEFHFPSLVTKHQQLRKLSTSSDPRERHMADLMLKTMAIINMPGFSIKGGSSYVPPQYSLQVMPAAAAPSK